MFIPYRLCSVMCARHTRSVHLRLFQKHGIRRTRKIYHGLLLQPFVVHMYVTCGASHPSHGFPHLCRETAQSTKTLSKGSSKKSDLALNSSAKGVRHHLVLFGGLAQSAQPGFASAPNNRVCPSRLSGWTDECKREDSSFPRLQLFSIL